MIAKTTFIRCVRGVNMACNCKDENGSPLSMCLGMCKHAGYNETNRFSLVCAIEDLIINMHKGQSDYRNLLGNHMDAIHKIISLQSEIISDAYRKGFVDGYQQGRES